MAFLKSSLPMWERLRRFRALEQPAQKLFLSAALLLPFVSLQLKIRGFVATRAMLESRLKTRELTQDNAGIEARTARTVRMVLAAKRYAWGKASCLEESIVLWYLLGRQGIESALRIGIRKDDGKFDAHAWVERDGVALNQPDAHHEHYAAFDAEFTSRPPEVE
jgi:transglutaminase superfamily protein